MLGRKARKVNGHSAKCAGVQSQAAMGIGKLMIGGSDCGQPKRSRRVGRRSGGGFHPRGFAFESPGFDAPSVNGVVEGGDVPLADLDESVDRI